MWRVASVVACFAVLAYFLQPSDRRRKDAPDVTPTESGEANSSKSKSGKGQKTKGPPYPRLPAEDRNASAVPVWTVHRLAEHSGSDRTRPLLLAILGEVYDVGPGERHYGPDAGYSGMAGKDASRSFTTGDFKKDAVPGLRDLSPEQLADVISWRFFYRNHSDYRFVGFLAGPYYDKEGQATPKLREIEAIDATRQKHQLVQKDLKSRFKGCNSKTSQDNPNSEIWCDESYHGKGTRPVFLSVEMLELGKEESWCACLTDPAMAAAREEEDPKFKLRLVEYSECNGKQRCLRRKDAPAPR